MIEVDDLINELKLELSKMPLNDRIKYLNSLGFNVSLSSEYVTKMPDEMSRSKIDNITPYTPLHGASNDYALYKLGSRRKFAAARGKLSKRRFDERVIKTTQIVKVIVKPLNSTLEKHLEINNNSIALENYYNYNPAAAEDLIFTFKIIYEDDTVEIQKTRGNTRKFRYFLKYLTQ